MHDPDESLRPVSHHSDMMSALQHHEGRSEHRYEKLMGAVKRGEKYKGIDMVKDEVHVHNEGGAMGGLGGLAALGGLHGGGAAWGLGGFVLGALVGNRRGGGLFGGDGDGCGAAAAGTFAIESKLGNIQQEIAQVGANTTQAISSLQYQGALANCQNFGELKMQGAAQTAAIISNNDQNTFKVLAAIAQNEKDNLIAKNVEQNARIVALETARQFDLRHAEVKEQITITNNNSAAANAVANARNDEHRWTNLFCAVEHTKQIASAVNQNIIAGNSAAVTTGAQTANPTNVNT